MEHYVRDGRGSMLVIGAGFSEEESSYQMEMLRKSRPAGLLPVQICAINDQREYRYDAGNLIPLSDYLEKRTISSKMLQQFIDSVKNVISSLEEYLLEADCLCMEPEHIYTEENHKLQFCYSPKAQGIFEKGLLKLLQFFLEKLDYNDKEGVAKAYQIYQNVVKEGYASVFACEIIDQQPVEPEVVFPWEEEEIKPEKQREEVKPKQKEQKPELPVQSIIYAAGILLCGAAAGICYWQGNLFVYAAAVSVCAAALYFLIRFGRRNKGIDSSQNKW